MFRVVAIDIWTDDVRDEEWFSDKGVAIAWAREHSKLHDETDFCIYIEDEFVKAYREGRMCEW